MFCLSDPALQLARGAFGVEDDSVGGRWAHQAPMVDSLDRRARGDVPRDGPRRGPPRRRSTGDRRSRWRAWGFAPGRTWGPEPPGGRGPSARQTRVEAHPAGDGSRSSAVQSASRRRPRSDHRPDDDPDDFPIRGGPVDHDRPVLGIAASWLELDPVAASPVEAFQSDILPDPRDHNVSLVRLGVPPYGDDVAGPVPDTVHALALDDQVEVGLRVDPARPPNAGPSESICRPWFTRSRGTPNDRHPATLGPPRRRNP